VQWRNTSGIPWCRIGIWCRVLWTDVRLVLVRDPNDTGT